MRYFGLSKWCLAFIFLMNGALYAQNKSRSLVKNMSLGIHVNGLLNSYSLIDDTPLPSQLKKNNYIGYAIGCSVSERQTRKFSFQGEASIIKLGYRFSYQNTYLPGGRFTSNSKTSHNYTFLNTQFVAQTYLKNKSKREPAISFGISILHRVGNGFTNSAITTSNLNIDRISQDTTRITIKTLDIDRERWSFGIPIRYERKVFKTNHTRLNVNVSSLINLMPLFRSSINIEQKIRGYSVQKKYSNTLKNNGSYLGVGIRLYFF